MDPHFANVRDATTRETFRLHNKQLLMMNLIYDYADIRSRLRGELKAQPPPKSRPLCPKCCDVGWVTDLSSLHVITCNACYNPKGLPSP